MFHLEGFLPSSYWTPKPAVGSFLKYLSLSRDSISMCFKFSLQHNQDNQLLNRSSLGSRFFSLDVSCPSKDSSGKHVWNTKILCFTKLIISVTSVLARKCLTLSSLLYHLSSLPFMIPALCCDKVLEGPRKKI